MDEPVLQTPPGAYTPTVTYAGFWKRFVAYIIDSVLMSVATFIIIIPLLGLLGIGIFSAAQNPEESDMATGFIALFIGAYFGAICMLFIAQWLYFSLMESKKGATLGKMALGIRVTDMDGNMISFGRATGRYFGKILSGITFGVGYIIAGFTQQKQALHDIIAKTLVVNK